MPYIINWPFGGFELWAQTEWWYNDMDSKMWPPANRDEIAEYENAENYLKKAVGTWRQADKGAFIEDYLAIHADKSSNGIADEQTDADDAWPNGPNWEDISMRGMHHSSRDERFFDVWRALDGLSTSPTNWWEEHGDHYETHNRRTSRGNLLQLACMQQYIADDFGPVGSGWITDNYREFIQPYVIDVGPMDTAFDVMQSVTTLDNTAEVEMNHARLKLDVDALPDKQFEDQWVTLHWGNRKPAW